VAAANAINNRQRQPQWRDNSVKPDNINRGIRVAVGNVAARMLLVMSVNALGGEWRLL